MKRRINARLTTGILRNSTLTVLGALSLAAYWWIAVHMEHEGYRTVYPPLAEWLFRLLHATAPGSVFAWKAVVAAIDFGTCLLLLALLRARGRPAYALIYAWNPLVLKELAGSGHVDAVMIFFLVLSIHLMDHGKRGAGLAAYGLAVLTKATPILLAGLYLRRTGPAIGRCSPPPWPPVPCPSSPPWRSWHGASWSSPASGSSTRDPGCCCAQPANGSGSTAARSPAAPRSPSPWR